MIWASKKRMTTTAVVSMQRSLLSSSVIKQPFSRTCFLLMKNNNNNNNHGSLLAASTSTSASSTTNAITRRTVHVEQHHSDDKDNNNNNKNDAAAKKKSPSTTTPRNRSRRTRTKRLALSLDDKEVPSYKEFVHRFTILSLYRGYLKCIRDSMPHNHDDLRDQVRKEFQVNKNDNDPFAVKRNIAEGQRRFEELKEFTGQSNKYTGDGSWINIKDEEDPRGRVGTGWPWAK